jgi:DNA-binding winged helix-turn-helix (wHTH) protein
VAPRYCFGGFTLSPASRLLARDRIEVPLVSRYLDLLILLVAERHRAVSRREIFDTVWADVVVTDGALTQAVRTLRRALGDDPRNPMFIRTVPRHGYQLIFPEVIEVPDDEPLALEQCMSPIRGGATADNDPFEEALARLLQSQPAADEENGNDAREAAIRLHQLGIEETLRRLDRRPGHARARALLRDVRWDLAQAGKVPLLGQPASAWTVVELIRLRLVAALRLVERRWLRGALGGAATGLLAGLAGAVALILGPGTSAGAGILVTLAVVGVTIGGLGAAGVGAGLAAAEAAVRSYRGLALLLGGASGGATVGAVTHTLVRQTLEGLVGGDLSAVAGGWEGLVIGAAAGLGYGLSTRPPEGGMATPRGLARLRTAALTGLFTAAAAVALAKTGSLLAAQSLDLLARTFPGSQVGLAPVARLFGEETPGPIALVVISGWEGFLFGLGLILGLTHRPRSQDED